MKELTGISASPGVAIAKAFFHLDEHIVVPRYEIHGDDVAFELERFHAARQKAVDDVNALREAGPDELSSRETDFLDAHLLMLSDLEFAANVEEKLRADLVNVEAVVEQVAGDLIELLRASSDQYLRERSVDIKDVSKRILNKLMYRERVSLADLKGENILVSHNLLPSDAVQMNARAVKGIAMDVGGKTSHTAILARAFEIPAVLGLRHISRTVEPGQMVIVDGNAGRVIIDPDEETLTQYKKMLVDYQRREVELLSLNDLPAETRDGKLIELHANIEVAEETDSVLSHGADGIGLYRSEFLFLGATETADEETQFAAYKRVLESMNGKGVTIRTLDVGGDKMIDAFDGWDENNPILGWRAVRFCLDRPDFFRSQLRALLRASVYGDLRIMFPMISGIEELDEVFEVVEEVKTELRRERIPVKENIPLGIMIEVPSAALTSDILAKKVDFFSIGTNDLIQYTIAVDRGNEKIAYLYEPFHPGVLRLIRTIIENAHDRGIPVSMCGEMAGDPYAAVVLLGLGLDNFSMSAFTIPEVKKIIRSVSVGKAEELVGGIMDMKSYRDIDRYVREWMDERFDFLNY